jgi:peptidoglycan/xylan/chitin deacetylase (PgdA/CDA1 family)
MTAPSGTRRSVATQLSSRVRNALRPEHRRAVRRATDGLVGPLGSLTGAHVREAVALTFDDGPGPWTRGILDVLARRHATATFFVLVEQAEADPDGVRRILDGGHEVGLHGLDHTRLTTMTATGARAHIAEGRARLEAVVERPVTLFRPPYGSQTPATFAAARRCGLRVVVWTCDAEDWIDHEPERIAELALARIRPGGTLLLHDGFVSDPSDPLPEPAFDRAAALDRVLDGLDERGLRARSVGELLALGRPRRTAWFRP